MQFALSTIVLALTALVGTVVCEETHIVRLVNL